MIQQVAALILLGYAPGSPLSHPGSGSSQTRAPGRAGTECSGGDAQRHLVAHRRPHARRALHRYDLTHVLAVSTRALTLAILSYWRTRLRFANATPPGATAIAPIALLALVCWLHPPARRIHRRRQDQAFA